MDNADNVKYCLEKLRENGRDRGYKIGVVKRYFRALNNDKIGFIPGTIVLYRDMPSNAILVEVPCDRRTIDRKVSEEDFDLFQWSIPNVPRDYLEGSELSSSSSS